MLHSPGSSRVPFLLAGQASRSALWKEQLKKHTLARSLHDRMQFCGLSLGSAAAHAMYCVMMGCTGDAGRQGESLL